MVAKKTVMLFTDIDEAEKMAGCFYAALLKNGIDYQQIIGIACFLLGWSCGDLVNIGGSRGQQNKDTALDCLDALRKDIEKIQLPLEAIQ